MNKTGNIQLIIKEIEKKKDDIAEKSLEVLTLQHQNIILLEQAHIQKDKLHLLEGEFVERKRTYDNLYIKYTRQNQNKIEEEFEEGDIDESKIKQPAKHETKDTKLNNKIEPEESPQRNDISDLEVLQGIQNYLDKQISRYDRYRMLKQMNKMLQQQIQNGEPNEDGDQPQEDEDIDDQVGDDPDKKQNSNAKFNPFKNISVRFKGGVGDPKKLVVSFRLEEKTKFAEIKRAACQYWQVKNPTTRQETVGQEISILKQNMNKNSDDYSYMDLCDESNSTLPDHQQVIKYLLLKGYKNLNSVTLILKIKENKSGLESMQNNSTKIIKAKEQSEKTGQYFVKRIQVNQINPYDFFFKEYPSLKFYIGLNYLKDSEAGQDQDNVSASDALPQQITDSHCCIITFILMIIVVTAVFLSQMTSVEVIFNSMNNIETNLQVEDTLMSVTRDNLDLYLSEVISINFFSSTRSEPYAGLLLQNYQQIGNTRLRFQLMKLSECQSYAISQQQYSCFDFDSQILETGDALKINAEIDNYEFKKFQNGPTDSYQQIDLSGIYGTYSPAGYMLSFNSTMTREAFIHQCAVLMDAEQNNSKIRVFIFSATMYNPNKDIWVSINLVFERDPFGSIEAYKPIIYFFQPNMYKITFGIIFPMELNQSFSFIKSYEGSQGNIMIALDVIRLVSTILLLLFVIRRIVGENSFGYIFTVYGILNLAVIGLSIASLIISLLHYSAGFNSKDLLNMQSKQAEEAAKLDLGSLTLSDYQTFQNKYYVDLTYVGYLYNVLQTIQAVLISVLIFRLIFVCSFSKHLQAVVETCKSAGLDLLKYYVIFLPLLISFAFIFYQIWGQTVKDFSNLTSSLCQVILMTIGFLRIDEIYHVDTIWSIIYILIFYIMIIILLFSFIVGILVESHHLTIMKKGYPSMQSNKITSSAIFAWILQWVPEKIKDEFNNFLQALKNEATKDEYVSEQNSFSDERRPFIQKATLKPAE